MLALYVHGQRALLLVALANMILPGSTHSVALAKYWWRYPSSDCGYDDVSPPQSCKGGSVAQCKARCLSTSGCGGFNFPHGVLKKTDCLAHKKPEGAVDLYVLEEKPQPPPSHAPWGVVWPVPRVSDWRHAAGPPLAVATTFGINVAASPASDQSARLTRAVQRYTDMIQQASRASPKVPHLVAPVTTLTLHVDSWDEALTSHTNASYTLTVTSAGAVVTAPTIYGAMYGMETFSQLPSLGSNLINATHITIADWPTYHHRAFMADTGRRFWPLPTIKSVLDAMATVKMNVLHLHLSDNCRFAVELEKYPLLTQRNTGNMAGTYTRSDIAEIVSYAGDRGIRVIPEVDFPGHAQGLQGLSGNGLEFCLTDNSTFRFADLANDPAGQTIATVKGIFTELAAMFPDEELFIGADEVSKNGNCTLSDYAKIESSVCKFISSAETGGLNRTVGGWEEYAFETNVAQPTERYVVNTWHYHTQYESTARGWQTIASNDSHFYLVYGGPYQDYWVDIASGMNSSQQALLRGGSVSAWVDEYCYIAFCIHPGKYPSAHALFPPEADELFHSSIIGYSFPRAAVGAGSFWNYVDEFNATEPDGTFRATYDSMNGRLIARGIPSCPTECHCDAASRCGTPYANESNTQTLTKEELFQLRPGQPLRRDRGIKTDDTDVKVTTLVPPCSRKPATGCPPLSGDSGPCGSPEECMVIMALFAECGPNRTSIQRHVHLTTRGYNAVTTSSNKTVARLLQQHVESMRQRVSAVNPINTWDPFYAAIFNASARQEIEMSVHNVSSGVYVNETASSPCAEAVLHEHAGEVDRFVSIGMPEMSGPAHPVPRGCPWHA